MVLSALIVLAKELSFPGGTPQALADALSKVTAAPVAVMRPEAPTFGKVSIKPSDDHLFKHHLKLQTQLESPVGFEGFGPTGWPDYLVVVKFRSSIQGRVGPESTDEPTVKPAGKGKVTVESGKFGSFMLKDMLSQLPGQPIVAHSFYERSVVAVSKGEWSLEQLAGCLAKAVGAKFVKVDEKKFKLDFSAADFRRRMLTRLDALIAGNAKQGLSPFETAQLQFKRDAYAQITNQDLDKVYKHGKEVVVDVNPNSSAGRSVKRYIQAYFDRDPSGKSVIEQVDFDRTVSIVFVSWGEIGLQAHTRGEQNRLIRF